MPAPAANQRKLAPLAAVTAAALVFTLLFLLVRLRWAPLESVDHGTAARLNSLVSGHPVAVSIVKAVTWLGSGGVLWTLTGAASVLLALRRRWRLTIYLLVTGAGELVLDPVLKALVGRLRPVVAHPIAYGTGNSFPSGHALGSIVCYGALLLVFLPAARGTWRRALTAVVVALIVAIGVSRLLLGVHYLSDVLGAWALGIAWLGVTAFAFELSRQAAGRPVTDPVTEGLEPEARADLQPTEPETTMPHDRVRTYARIAAAVLVAWVLIVGAITGIGKLIMITGNGNGNLLGDHTIPQWFAAHRTATLNHWSLDISNLGATQDILIVSVAACVVLLALTRRWRPVIFVAVVMLGELAAFLTSPTSSSGHGRRYRTWTRTCPRRRSRRVTWPPPRASTSASRSWRSALPTAGGATCSSSPPSSCRSSSPRPACTGASTIPPTSSPACCSPRCG